MRPKFLGPWQTWKRLAASWIKCQVYRLLTPLRADRFLIALRNRRPDPAEREAARHGLCRIASMPVPGWDDAIVPFTPFFAAPRNPLFPTARREAA